MMGSSGMGGIKVLLGAVYFDVLSSVIVSSCTYVRVACSFFESRE